MAKFEKKFTNFDPEFLGILEQELSDNLKSAKYNSKDEQELKSKCRAIKVKDIASNYAQEVCQGDDAVRTMNVAVNTHLQTKYPWMKWLVVVFKGSKKLKDLGSEEDSHERSPYCDRSSSGRFVLAQSGSGERNAFVAWTRPGAEIESKVERAVVVLKKVIGNEDVNEGRDSKEFENILETIKSQDLLKKGGRVFCVFGGRDKNYKRSIFTSAIGTFRSFHTNGWFKDHTFDFVISFNEDQ